MIEIQGKYNSAKIFIDDIESTALSQIYSLINHSAFKDSKIRIMPDCHGGKGCLVGFTASNIEVAIPNIIGVDISCGMLALNLGDIELNLEEIDNFIINNIPNGSQINDKIQFDNPYLQLEINNVCKKFGDKPNRHLMSVGSLGGGNHFIEIAKDNIGNKWLIIHSGSRNFGLKVAKYHQNIAKKYCFTKRGELRSQRDKYLGTCKNLDQDKVKELEENLDRYKVPKELSFLEGELVQNYLSDMKVAMDFAHESRKSMAKRICDFIGVKHIKYQFETLHNYFDYENKIIRKGAASSKEGENILIPINMRDGSILAVGKGNSDWNESAPHGAGRVLSRSKAKELLDMDGFSKTMSGIFSTSISESTLDEAPQAYKDMSVILDNIGDTVKVLDILKPIYNFKAHK